MPGRPMFLCLHGWGSNEDDLADLMQYIAPYNDYVSLRAPIVLQEPGDDGRTSGAYSWFAYQRSAAGAIPAADDLDRDAFAAARAIDRWVDEHVPIDRDIVPIGFSQGGLLAIHLLRIHPERYRAAVSLSGPIAPGNVPGTAPADDRLADFDTPVFYVYGKNDAVIPKYELFAAAAWLEEHTWLTTKSYRALGHEVSLEEFADLRQWLMLNGISSGVL
ncbi:esterase [Bifidobacterium sp. SO1]|nr:esterase [Bifidobacterium sp. SO1]MBW3079167.1 esterase [Bifidobacterium simiiventris]